MPPVHSPSATSFRIRRRRVSPTTALLFPECPDALSPKQAAQSPARTMGQHNDDSNRPVPDCPPVLTTSHGNQDRAEGPIRVGVPNHSESANARLVGIARLAASSPPAETRRKSPGKPEYFVLPVKSILNKCESNRVPFDWTINPYRGCEFACKYCYARYTHEFMELDGLAFEKKIFVKKDAAVLLTREIATKYSFASGHEGAPEHICIGTATDPYQPAEREYGVTRACLEELARHNGLSVSITTKSNLITRDIDVLQEISRRSRLYVDITVTTLRPRLARLLEPRAPRPGLRLGAIRKLRDAGISVGAMASPLVPGITDREGELEALAAAAKEAGAQRIASGVLFLI